LTLCLFVLARAVQNLIPLIGLIFKSPPVTSLCRLRWYMQAFLFKPFRSFLGVQPSGGFRLFGYSLRCSSQLLFSFANLPHFLLSPFSSSSSIDLLWRYVKEVAGGLFWSHPRVAYGARWDFSLCETNPVARCGYCASGGGDSWLYIFLSHCLFPLLFELFVLFQLSLSCPAAILVELAPSLNAPHLVLADLIRLSSCPFVFLFIRAFLLLCSLPLLCIAAVPFFLRCFNSVWLKHGLSMFDYSSFCNSRC